MNHQTGMPVIFQVVLGVIIVFAIFLIGFALSGRKKNRGTHGSDRNTSDEFDNNSLTHNAATWGAADSFNNQDMNNEMNTHGTPYSDKDHDGIPDQFDTHDNRFDSTMSNDSTSSFDSNSWSNDSSSGGFDSGGSSGGSSDNTNF